MGPGVGSFLILSALLQGASSTDTSTYADRATRELVARAMARHHEQDTTVRDYRASLKYRLQFALGKRRWAQLPIASVEEQAATLQWQYPNDIRVDLLGRRSASRMGVDLNSSFERPWFVPRMLGDSLRVFGAEMPSRAAPHPFAPGADRYYRYSAGDSLTITTRTRRVTIRTITVTPKQSKGSFVTGRLWVDVATGDVARFTFRFVGTELWAIPASETDGDAKAARRANEIVTRILQLDADLEYGLQDDKYWMPFRQVLSGRVSLPIIEIVVPFEATTTFDDYAINTRRPIVFDAPFPDTTARRGRSRVTRRNAPDSLSRGTWRQDPADSLYGRDRTGYQASGGRYQVHRPPTDSLMAYSGWTDSLTFDQDDAERRRIREAIVDIENMAEALPPEMTGKPGLGLAWEKLPELFRYNRVQGTTLSATMRTRTPLAYTLAFGTLRYGVADRRIMASVSAVRDAPGGRLTVTLGRDLADVDPFAKGLTFGNSLRAAFTGHDDGEYLLAQGGRFDFETSAGLGTELTLSGYGQDQQSVTVRGRATIPRIFSGDGYFPPNAPVREGFATGAGVRIEHAGYRTRAILAADGMHIDGEFAGRVAGELRFPDLAGGWLRPRFKAGIAFGADEVPQMALRAGGASTVRGYDFARERGDLMWAAQVDVTRPGKSALRKSLFIDAGQAGPRDAFGRAKVLVGAGIGVSVLDDRFRMELSHPITAREGRGLRFDFIFGGIR